MPKIRDFLASRPATEEPAVERVIPRTLVAVLGITGVISLFCVVTFPDDQLNYWGIYNLLTDLHVYRWGGEYVSNSLPLYDGLIHSLDPSQSWRGPMPYTYTPFSAALFVVLANLSFQLMEAAWLGLIAASTVVVCWTMLSWLGYRRDNRLLWASIFFAATMVFTEPVRTTFWLGQINMVLLALMVLDAAAKGRWRGALTGIAAGIKLTPGFLWIHYLVTKQYRSMFMGVAAFVGTIIVGAIAAPRDSLHFWTGGLFEAERIGDIAAPSNQSASGVLAYYFFDGGTPRLVWLFVALVCAAVGLAVAYRVHFRGQPQLAFVISGMTGCVISPFSWGHHWVWFVPLMVVLVHLLIQHARRGWALLAWVLPFVLYFFIGAWTFTWPVAEQPEGLWIGTGWFMSGQALIEPWGIILHEPYLVVWLATLIGAYLLTAKVRAPEAPGTPAPSSD